MISMKKVNYAAIDIGSNAVRLLIKCVNEENAPELMSKVQLIRIPLRLGEDAFTMGVISAEKEKRDIFVGRYSHLKDISLFRSHYIGISCLCFHEKKRNTPNTLPRICRLPVMMIGSILSFSG